jgi:hypothetical protein
MLPERILPVKGFIEQGFIEQGFYSTPLLPEPARAKMGKKLRPLKKHEPIVPRYNRQQNSEVLI